ncbi:hypothetical protein BC739_005550 [Kutzneria viridogrisea]|uniref:3-methyladenine DNA glycosylase n=1 Tax=Kutzneria viridogrisea TaxID=47990 RepID=A0ABR6BN44_9PSEU|nr:hypothetical protein [Kutzneria viridogrisea]
MGFTVLAEPEWRARQQAHLDRVSRWTGPHARRRSRGEKHPVVDFLFTYYSHRPAHLERWHPGPGVLLAGPGARERLSWRGYHEVAGGVALDVAEFGEPRRRNAAFSRSLLTATAARRARLGCFGLHEWAMVYRTQPAQIRHVGWPLRLGHGGTDRVVESQRVQCSHYDAYRFFTEPARPLNAVRPTRQRQLELEQPGCLHNNMDLYRAAYKLDPFLPSELVADCFELAVDIRELDMRASPYDLSELGYQPVRIETEEGRAEYVRAQASFAERARPLRQALIEHCGTLLDWSAS